MRASLALAFFSRIVMGCFSGSIAVTQSAIADLSDEKSRAKNFGLIGAAFGASLFIGPALGGFLSDPAIRPWFNYATPFWLSSFLTLANIGQVAWQLSETLPPEKRRHADFHLLIGPLNIMRAFQDAAVSRNMFLVVFFLGFGFNFFTQFFQVFLIDQFAATRSQLGMIFSYIGIWSILTQAVIVPKVSKKFRPPQVLTVTLLLSAGIFPVLLLVPNYPLLFAVLACIPLTNGLSNPNLTALISGLGGDEQPGRDPGHQPVRTGHDPVSAAAHRRVHCRPALHRADLGRSRFDPYSLGFIHALPVTRVSFHVPFYPALICGDYYKNSALLMQNIFQNNRFGY